MPDQGAEFEGVFRTIERKRKLNISAIFFTKAIAFTLLLGPIFSWLYWGEEGGVFMMSYIITCVTIYFGLKRSKRPRLFPLEKMARLESYIETINSSLKLRREDRYEHQNVEESMETNLHLAYRKFEKDEYPSTYIYNLYTGKTGSTKYRFFDILIARTKGDYQSSKRSISKIYSIEKVAVLINDEWDFRTAYILPNKSSKFHREKIFGYQRPIDSENYPSLAQDFTIYSNDKQILNYLEGLSQSLMPFVSGWDSKVAFQFHENKIYIVFVSNPNDLMKLNLSRSNRKGKSAIRIYHEIEDFIEQIKKLQESLKMSKKKKSRADVHSSTQKS